MEETNMAGTQVVDGSDQASYVWGEEKPKGNYKSVSVRGEVYEVGHCVQCNLESKESFIWKILKLFQVEGRKECRLRRLFSEPELPRNVKGLDPPAEPKELFMASGGAEVQENVSLENLARRYIVFCTFQDDDNLNLIPSTEIIEKADYFFRRGYDPASEEIVQLDGVVEELGAQNVFNKSWWWGDNVGRRSSSQVSAARAHSQSPASGSSAHQGVAKGMYSSAPEVSPAPSRDSTERKLTKRKSDNLAPEQHKVDAVEQKNEYHAPKKRKASKSVSRSECVVFALPAPSRINLFRAQGVSPVIANPPASTVKPIQREGEGHILKTSSSPTALVGSNQAEATDGMSDGKKRKYGEMPGEGTVKRVIKPGERSNAPSGRENPLKHLKKPDEVIGMATSLGSKQAVTKVGGGSVERHKKSGENPREGAVKRVLKPSEETVKKVLKPSALPGNPSKLQKRADEEIVATTAHAARKVSSAPSSHVMEVKKRTLEIPPVNPSAMKSGRSVPSASPRALIETGRTEVGSRVQKRDEDVAIAPSTSQRKSGSPPLNLPATNFVGSTPKDPSHPKKSQGLIFKPKIEDWDVTLVQAISSNRVLLLKNVDTEIHSEDLAEALTELMRTKCEVRIAPPVSFSYRTTTALVKLPSFRKAQEFLKELESNHLLVANRVVTAFSFSLDEFKGPQILKYPGHLEFSQVRDYHVEDYRNAVATSHLAQGNTIEFAYGLPWRVLDEQHEDQWRMLQESHSMLNTKTGSR